MRGYKGCIPSALEERTSTDELKRAKAEVLQNKILERIKMDILYYIRELGGTFIIAAMVGLFVWITERKDVPTKQADKRMALGFLSIVSCPIKVISSSKTRKV